MTDIPIGKHDTGFWDKGNPIMAKKQEGNDSSFNTAKDIAENRSVSSPTDVNPGMMKSAQWDTGAEVIVGKKEGGAYKFDTYQLVIKDSGLNESDKKITDSTAVKFFNDATSKLGGEEAYIVDENNKIQVLLPGGDTSDKALSLKVLEHTKARELEAVDILISNIDGSKNKSVLTELVGELKNLKNNVEQKEGQLKTQISSENSKLSKMEAPFKQRISNAETEVSRSQSQLQTANTNLKEAIRPGIHLIEATVSNSSGNLKSLESTQRTLESDSVGSRSTISSKASKVFQLEAKNARLWYNMNDPNSSFGPGFYWNDLINNRKEITSLKKEIFLESSKIDRKKDLANELLPGIRSQVQATRELQYDLERVKNGNNQGPVSSNPQAGVDKAKSNIESAYKNLQSAEGDKIRAEKSLETARKAIESHEDKFAMIFVLKEEINDIKFQLQNMDKYSSWASDWSKDNLRRSMVDKIFEISRLESELGIINRTPSYNDIQRHIGSIYDDPFAGNNPVTNDPFAGGGSGSVYDDPFANTGGLYTDPFASHGNIYSDPFSGNSSFGSETALLDGLVSAWNSATQAAGIYRRQSNFETAKSQLSQAENSLARAHGRYQATIISQLENLPNSTEGAISSARQAKGAAESKLSSANSELGSANNALKTDSELVKQRTVISNLQGELNNTSGTFEKLSNEAKKKLGL